MTTASTKNFWQGTNFWVALALLIANLWTSFNTETGDTIIQTVTAIVAGIFAIRQMTKNGEVNFKKWLSSANTWNYLGQLITMIFGAQFADLLPPINDLIEAIGAGNFQAILSAVFSLGTIIFYLVRDNFRTKVLTEAQVTHG